jgi:hypothetical protein
MEVELVARGINVIAETAEPLPGLRIQLGLNFLRIEVLPMTHDPAVSTQFVNANNMQLNFLA